ncbi:MAG: hypothetical protein HRU20_26515 [Pseudomonadales bacterium]|nr:hypothetical protein [Pseudomonadales bacterium]
MLNKEKYWNKSNKKVAPVVSVLAAQIQSKSAEINQRKFNTIILGA